MVQGMAMKKFVTDPALCRDMFFGGPNDDNEEYEDTITDVTNVAGYDEEAEAEANPDAEPNADADANTADTANDDDYGEEAEASPDTEAEANGDADANTADTATAATATSSVTQIPRMAKLSDSDIQKYQEFFARDTKVSTDTKNLPWPSMKMDRLGRASYVNELPPCLVVGGTQDFMVDEKGCIETANYFGLMQENGEEATREITIEEKRQQTKRMGLLMVDAPHDLMLVPQWKDIADELQAWIQSVA
ncbi:unnamed protein product [Cylindrotheca closterium]|uniref:Uncharacterized protein n=1 Tax=Cylindrotheca closterium TaxID=2856 RepID=A0AAD2JHA3_9STRA|nr:unnamed protein product [Cylindrotheca closterium]